MHTRDRAKAPSLRFLPDLCEDRTGHRVLDIFEEEGVDLRAVTVGHCNDSLDKDYVVGLARRGATVGLDRFNPNRSQEELERRAQLALAVIKAGYASHMTLSQLTENLGDYRSRPAPVIQGN